jgi:hypothetical protein
MSLAGIDALRIEASLPQERNDSVFPSVGAAVVLSQSQTRSTSFGS